MNEWARIYPTFPAFFASALLGVPSISMVASPNAKFPVTLLPSLYTLLIKLSWLSYSCIQQTTNSNVFHEFRLPLIDKSLIFANDSPLDSFDSPETGIQFEVEIVRFNQSNLLILRNNSRLQELTGNGKPWKGKSILVYGGSTKQWADWSRDSYTVVSIRQVDFGKIFGTAYGNRTQNFFDRWGVLQPRKVPEKILHDTVHKSV